MYMRFVKCSKCNSKAIEYVRYSGQHLCTKHFKEFIERKVKREIRKQVRFRNKVRLGIAVSGGKDSMTALHITHKILKERKNTKFVVITVDEGIESYRSSSIPIVRRKCEALSIEHIVASMKSVFGISMDEVASIKTEKSPCTYCGVMRRYIMNKIARECNVDYLVMGLNIDDVSQSVIMNIMRGDVSRLARMAPHVNIQEGLVPRILPLKTVTERESYLYAYVEGIEFHDEVCPYSEQALRNEFREIIYNMEKKHPGTRFSILKSLDEIKDALLKKHPPVEMNKCEKCNEPSIGKICEACILLDEIKSSIPWKGRE